MDHTFILDEIPVDFDLDALVRKLRIGEETNHRKQLSYLVAEARAIANPKAIYRVAYVDSRGSDYIIVDGTKLTSRVLAVNLQHAHRVFAYTVTCGRELHSWATKQQDIVDRFWADEIAQTILHKAMKTLRECIVTTWALGPTSTMSPGRIEDWPLSEQKPLFSLLGDTESSIGMHLTDSMVIYPTKSVSGILFPTEEHFESCQLCPREYCPNRRMPYEKELYAKKYQK